MVMEHLQKPQAFFREAWRILKPGGLLLIHTPNKNSYNTLVARIIPQKIKTKIASILQGRKEEEVYPAYYRANTVRRLTALAQAAKLQPQTIRMLVSSAETAVIPPLMILELLFIRLLMTKPMRAWRPNILAAFRKA